MFAFSQPKKQFLLKNDAAKVLCTLLLRPAAIRKNSSERAGPQNGSGGFNAVFWSIDTQDCNSNARRLYTRHLASYRSGYSKSEVTERSAQAAKSMRV